MNKRIQELAEDAAGTRKHVPPVWQFYDEELEKFAELIVLECAKIVATAVDRREPASTYASKILELSDEIL